MRKLEKCANNYRFAGIAMQGSVQSTTTTLTKGLKDEK
jgi:hypothetical protein